MEQAEADNPATGFKKPVLLFGKIGKLPKKLPVSAKNPKDAITAPEPSEPIEESEESAEEKTNVVEELKAPAQQLAEKSVPLPYREPAWSGLPDAAGNKYGFEILKQGSIIGNLNLQSKPFFVFGRLPQCDITMAHPTVSRYHAVVQYRTEETDEDKKGFYLYDLGSTHGTFLNKLRLKPHNYVRLQVGHMIKLGCSSRNYILTGPDEDQENESEFSVTELKQKRVDELARRERLVEEAALKAEQDRIAREKKEEERGVDWGMGDDADEETDLAENPYAQTNNEELYLDDPKKALRGFMEREGVDWEYDCSEQGMGQFVCKVVLPIDDERGRPIVAEVIHKGKKKEAVVQCALEACRIIDRHGLLRQATHESKKRKSKNWEDDDFYDSDDDTFLDRTGTIERKRLNRMKTKQPQQAETYQSLLEKETKISTEIKQIEQELAASRAAAQKVANDAADSLDSFMEELKQPKLDKQKVTKLKTDLIKLKQEHAHIIKLVNIARPADLPPLVPQYDKQHANVSSIRNKLPMFGKRLKLKVEKPQTQHANVDDDEDEDDPSEDKPAVINVEKVQMRQDPTETIVETGETVEEKKQTPNETEPIKKPDAVDVDKEKEEEIELERKRKKNQRRIQQRQEKQEAEKLRGYEEDFSKEDYNMWVPPTGQTGDGKTTLNDKFGY